jgi:murein L,D-transpeptidase YcbB/YkuD
MPKIFKMTKEQAKILAEHLDKQKKIVSENTETLSPEAEAYYAANPEAAAEREKQKMEDDAEQMKEQDPAGAVDPETQQLLQAVQQHLQTKAAPANANTSTTAPAPTPAPSNPAPGTGPQPAPTGNEQPAPSPDSTEALRAKSDMAVEPGTVQEKTPGPATATPAPTTEAADSGLVFTSEVEVTAYNAQAKAYELGAQGAVDPEINGKLTLKWELEVQANRHGIKSLSTNIHNISGHLFLTFYDQQDNPQEQEFEFNSADWNVVDNIVIGSSIQPGSVDIDFAKKIIEVS